MPHPIAIGRRAALLLGLAGPASAQPTETRARYGFDESSGRLEFTARHLGLLSSAGRFERFSATLLIDPAKPLTADIAVDVMTEAVALPFPGAVDLLRSPDFFDVARHPMATFRGAATGEGTLAGFAIAGQLTIRGITRPQRMQARLVERRMDAALGREVADFEASGELRRSEFGMVAERFAIGDGIRLRVAVRLVV